METGRSARKFHIKKKKRKDKIVITFNENDRRDFLTGFHKRKLQRKNKANEEFEKQFKLEKKRIKTEAKEAYKKLLVTQICVPKLDTQHSEEIDMGTHSVYITELSTAEVARQNNWIGINEVKYESLSEEMINNHSDDQLELEGMDMKDTKTSSKGITYKNCRDVKKAIKHQATINVKNSKIFQKKSKIEKIKHIKKQKKEARKRRKLKKKLMNGI